MAVLVVAVAALLLGVIVVNRGSARAAGEAAMSKWRREMEPAAAEARRDQRPLLLYFTADWCEPCRMVRERVLPLPRVDEAVHGRFVPVIIDVTKPTPADNRWMNDLGVIGIPTFAVLRPDLRPIAVSVVPSDPGELIKWLNDSADRANETAPNR